MVTAIDMIPGPEMVNVLSACWAEGEVVLILDPRLSVTSQDRLMRNCGVTKVLSDSGVSHFSRTEASEIYEPGDALVMPTSGTTGEPKGVVLTQQALRASSEITTESLGLQDDDHWLCCIPPSHIGGLSVITRAIHNNLALTVLPKFDSAAVEGAAREGATMTSLVNTALRQIDPSLFRKILLGGSAPVANRPAHVIATYGMTETASGVVYNGRPLRGIDVRCDADSQIWLRSPTMFRCYTDGAAPFDDGWFATGDAGEFSGGLLRVFGRSDDVIISGGDKIWPAEVEAALRSHPSIAEVVVFGEADPQWDERVAARAELKPGFPPPSLDELREAVKHQVASYAAPKSIDFVEQLPRTASGKLKRPARGGSRTHW